MQTFEHMHPCPPQKQNTALVKETKRLGLPQADAWVLVDEGRHTAALTQTVSLDVFMATKGETKLELLSKQDGKCSSGYLKDTMATTKLAGGRDQQAVTSRLAPPKAMPVLAPAYSLAADGISLVAHDTLLRAAAPATREELARQEQLQQQKQQKLRQSRAAGSLKKTLKQAIGQILSAVCYDQSDKDCDASYDPRDDASDKFAVRRSKWRVALCACVICCTKMCVWFSMPPFQMHLTVMLFVNPPLIVLPGTPTNPRAHGGRRLHVD
jgi:hypothetical protein